MAPAQHRTGVFLDTRVMLVGGGLALVGLLLLGFFMWMVPNAAAREAKSACTGLVSQPPINPALCPGGGTTCKYPIPAPDFTAYDHNGKQVHLSDFRGKVVLLNFWASWCGVCKHEKPQLSDMADDLGGDDFTTIALASDRNWRDVLVAIVDALSPRVNIPGLDGKDAPADYVFDQFQKAHKEVPMQLALEAYKRGLPDGVPFQVLLDPPSGDGNIGAIAESWGIHAVPESALIDRDGNIRAYFINKRDWKSPVAETCLRSVIDGD